jgi:hypothetical protein
MSALFKKLNWKGQAPIVVLNAPESFEAELALLPGTSIVRDLKSISEITFAIVFVQTQKAVEAAAKAVNKKALGDAIVWFAYPKQSSKKYTCEFNRDTGWDALGEAGFEGVRQVAIDEDWSALRFRRVEQIKKFTRSEKMALSSQGKARAKRAPKKD